MHSSFQKFQQLLDEAYVASNPTERMQHIVSQVQTMMAVPVASLYILGSDGVLRLVASEGLNTEHADRVCMKLGEGLIGTIAQTKHPLNLANGKLHPNFRHFPETGEDNFCAFMGTPIIHAGQLIGVLSVERESCQSFSTLEESFLVTAATYLGTLSPSYFAKSENQSTPFANQWLEGVQAAPGIGIGRILTLHDDDELMSSIDATTQDIPAELERLKAAISAVCEDISKGKENLSNSITKDIAEIFEIYLMLLQGKEFSRAIEKEIESGKTAITGLRIAISGFVAQFEAMDDPYFRARAEDIRHLGNQVYAKLRQAEHITIGKDEKVILAGTLISVSDIASYATEQLAGIISTEGSSLSHTAVLAKALGLPAVMGIENFHSHQPDALVIVDGHHGRIMLKPDAATLEKYQKRIDDEQSSFHALAALKDLPAATLDGQRIQLFANTGLLTDISPGLRHGAEGIGLYRSEIPFLIRDSFPSEEEQIAFYQPVLEAYKGMPVCIRTLDAGGDKPLPYYPIDEENPALGWRGIRFSLDNSSLFMTQIRAMLRSSAGLSNLHIMLPMVSTVEEVTTFRSLLDEAYQQLLDEGYTLQRPAVGLMAEVPAIIPLLPFLKGQIDFISIGSNDLSQYLLAVDRNNARVSHRFDHLHPAVLHAVREIVAAGKQLEVPVSICGEMAADPYAAPLLIGMGVTRLSMVAFSIPRIKHLIRSISFTEAQELDQRAQQSPTTQSTRALVQDYLNAKGLATSHDE